ncbi:hypothetical protein [Nocardia arthritidis]|uniref:Uncharacterized protein n=1 Tax=Nocardia arthritidis TaxID=228602 RepID=A0A6G9Y9H8_9NOCA|nr:hypothetical protein [Nocardia arthritidis]QIS09804.1 hypothetical protein F5544_09520 [Nocardia arthritidis]
MTDLLTRFLAQADGAVEAVRTVEEVTTAQIAVLHSGFGRHRLRAHHIQTRRNLDGQFPHDRPEYRIAQPRIG